MPPLLPLNKRNMCQNEEQNLVNVITDEESTLNDPAVLALPEHQQEFIKDSFEIAKDSSEKVLFKCYMKSNIIISPTLGKTKFFKSLPIEEMQSLPFKSYYK